MKATEIRKGMGVKFDGKIGVLVGVEHRTPGNLRAFIQAKIKFIKEGNTIERRLASSEDIDVIDLDRRDMEYLYNDPTGATFMDLETYDQIVLPADVLGDALLYLRPNTQIIVLMHEGNPVSIELPTSVDLKVTDTPPGIKGATATNQMKDAELETGLKTKVPPFIEIDEEIKINTADGSYMSRAKD